MVLFLLTLYGFFIFSCKEYYQFDFTIDYLVMSMCRFLSCVVRRGCLLWPVCSLGKILLAFALLYFVLQGQTFILLQVSPDFLLLHSSTIWWKILFFFLLLVLEIMTKHGSLEKVMTNYFSILALRALWTKIWNWNMNFPDQ